MSFLSSFLLLSRISVSVRCGLQVLGETPSFILKKGRATEKEVTVLRSMSLFCKVGESGVKFVFFLYYFFQLNL